MKKLLVPALLLAAAGGLAILFVTLPPATIELDQSLWRPQLPGAVVRGVYHVHTSRSDGTGTLDDVARAAGRAGVDFVLVTDHGDATRSPEPPSVRSGVLVVDGVEISTTGGHYVALGLPAAPYPLAGEPGAVVEDVARLGGVGIVAHPDSPKGPLAWTAWDEPVDGFEWLNADSAWRDESISRLLLTLGHYPIRAVESLTALFERPDRSLARWDEQSSTGRRLVAVAGADAHARLGWRDGVDPYESGFALELPSYETMFRTFSLLVELDAPFTGVPADDTRRLLDAMRAGRVLTVLDGWARGGRLEFSAEAEGHTYRMGDVITTDGPVRFTVRTLAPAGAEIRLLENGVLVAASTGLELLHEAAPASTTRPTHVAYRVEISGVGRTRHAAPWILTNPIYVKAGSWRDDAGEATETADLGRVLFDRGEGGEWWLEKDPASEGQINVRDEDDHPVIVIDYRLATGRSEAWVAAVHPLPPSSPDRPWRRLSFRARSDVPSRVSIQVRAPSAAHDQRWQRSVYLDPTDREVSLALDDLLPVRTADPDTSRHAADTLLIVVDRTNSQAGARGRLEVAEVRLY